jgi:hypothetical protein
MILVRKEWCFQYSKPSRFLPLTVISTIGEIPNLKAMKKLSLSKIANSAQRKFVLPSLFCWGFLHLMSTLSQNDYVKVVTNDRSFNCVMNQSITVIANPQLTIIFFTIVSEGEAIQFLQSFYVYLWIISTKVSMLSLRFAARVSSYLAMTWLTKAFCHLELFGYLQLDTRNDGKGECSEFFKSLNI